jgi:hypothetical protein
MTGTFNRVAFALILSVAGAAAQQPLESRGAWRLVADGEDFALRSQATRAPDGTLSLQCRKAQQAYAFELKSPVLADRKRGDDIRIAFKVDEDDQAWFNLASGPDGTVPIAQQTVFWILYGAVTHSGAKAVTFTVDNHTWRFALDGLRDLTDSLMTRCEFEPVQAPPERRTPLSR